MLLLTEKIILKYTRFYHDLSGYYMVFIIYIAALTLMRKNLCVSFQVNVTRKRGLPKPKFLYENFFPSPTLSYTITYKQNYFFAVQKSLRILKPLRVFNDRVLFRVLSDNVLFRFLSDGIFCRFFSDRVLFMVLIAGSPLSPR